MSIFETNMEDLLNDTGNTAADGAEVMKQMETDIPIHPLVSLASIAVSAKRIADELVKIQRQLHDGDVGQGNNLRQMTQEIHNVRTEVGNVSSAAYKLVNARVVALEDELRRVRGF